MIIKNKTILKNLKDEPLKNSEDQVLILGEALANMMIGADESGKMKSYILAKKLFKEKETQLDSADFALLKRIVSVSKVYNALVVGQCEELLENSENEKGSKGK